MTTDSEAVTNLMLDQAKKLRPWAMPWWAALIQGVLAGGLGLLYLLRPNESVLVMVQFLALFLLIMGLLDTVAGLVRERATTAADFAFYRGLVGFVGGLVLLSLIFLGFFNSESRVNLGQTIIGIVAAVYGALGLALVFMRQQTQGRVLSIIGALIFLLLGLALIVPALGALINQWLGPALLVLGVGLIVFAFVRRSRTGPEATASGAA